MRKSLFFLIIIIVVVSIPLALLALNYMVNILIPTDPSNPTRLLDFTTSSNIDKKKNTLLDCVNYYEDLFSDVNKTGTLMTSKDYRQGFFVDLCETGYKDSDGTYTHLFSEDLQQQYYNLTISKRISSIFR